MLTKYSSLLAVVIGTMMSTNQAVKLQYETGLISLDVVTETVQQIFESADTNRDKTLSGSEFWKAMRAINQLVNSGEIIGEKKFLKQLMK